MLLRNLQGGHFYWDTVYIPTVWSSFTIFFQVDWLQSSVTPPLFKWWC